MSRSKHRIKYNYAMKWESTGSGHIPGTQLNETFARIFESMLRSSAFKELTLKQRLLYVYCKSQWYGKRKPTNDFRDLYLDNDCFYFSRKDALAYKLYSRWTVRNLYQDMRELEKKGFIKIISSGKPNKMKSIYCFSDEWKNYK